jgi:Tol biopolymer transport system component
MSEYRSTLERELKRLQPPRIPFDELARRRDRKRRDQRIRAAVLGLAIAIAVGWWGFHEVRSTTRPADDSGPKPGPTELRRNGEVLVFKQKGTRPVWDLAAQDPDTGGVRTIVGTEGIVDCRNPERCSNFFKSAEWSSDGRWAAFDVSFLGQCGPTAGVWVTNGVGEPRQLTTPCDPPGSDRSIEEVWAWAPEGARLAYALIDGGTDELFVIDPSDGRRTSLGKVDGGLTDDQLPKTSALEWSPDGTRIAYADDGGSVYVVEVDGGERSALADSFVDVIDIAWSPDGTRILVQDQGRARMQVMNADGSDLHLLLEGEDACCETEWSPNEDRILYQLSKPEDRLGFSFDSEVWTVSSDGSNRIKVFDSDGCDMGDIADALPVWAPTGTQVAYNACGVWVVANADGTGEAQPIDELVHRSWDGGGLFTAWPPGG